MDGHERHVDWFDAALMGCVGVGAGRGFPDAGVLDGEQSFEVLADSCLLEQALGDGDRTIVRVTKRVWVWRSRTARSTPAPSWAKGAALPAAVSAKPSLIRAANHVAARWAGTPTSTNRVAKSDMSERVSFDVEESDCGQAGPSILTGRSELGIVVSMLLRGRLWCPPPGTGCRGVWDRVLARATASEGFLPVPGCALLAGSMPGRRCILARARSMGAR